ncbi:MAG: galactokinase family protein [Candidatus Thorarchaeota archaeon]
MYSSSAPARVCLYGEHQDYLELRVIPAAINLRVNVSSFEGKKNMISVFSRELNQTVKIPIKLQKMSSKTLDFRSYIESGILALKKINPNIEIPSLDVRIQSDIPIASGLSSSAALLVAWIKHLCGVSEIEIKKEELAELAYHAEHNLLGIPCGRMDQYSSSIGGIISLTCTEPPEFRMLPKPNFQLVVVDSQTPKLTSQIHGSKVKEIKDVIISFETETGIPLRESSISILEKYIKRFNKKEKKVLTGIISIKQDTEEAEQEMLKSNPDINILGDLLTSQQISLRENLDVSLPILDRIIDTAIINGALGGKLTGAGLGGSVVILTEEENDSIIDSLKTNFKLPIWSVEIDDGATFIS